MMTRLEHRSLPHGRFKISTTIHISHLQHNSNVQFLNAILMASYKNIIGPECGRLANGIR